MKTMDLGVRCGRLLVFENDKPVINLNQWMGIEGSTIREISPIRPEHRAQNEIDATDKLVIPGLINAHSHLPMTLFRGLADDLPFHEWLFDYIVPLEAKLVNPDFVRLGTELACYEALQHGVTTLHDMYYFESDIADVCDKMGVRAVLGQTLWDWNPAPDDKEKKGLQKNLVTELVKKYSGHARIVPAIAPHAPYSCSTSLLEWCRDFARDHKIPLTIHVSETKLEVENSLKEFGKTPVRRLHDLRYFDAKSSYAHAVHVNDDDIKTLADSGIGVIHNPESNMKLGSGAAPIRKMLQAGVTVGLGTDGPASNNDLNMFSEMRTAALLQKLVCSDNTALTAAQAVHMATLGSARALGIDSLVGSLEVGKRADFAVVDLSSPHMSPMHSECAQLVYAATGQEVVLTVVDGKIVFDKTKPAHASTVRRMEAFCREKLGPELKKS